MFCSWRKSPFAPCSCAYQLRGPVSEILNQLCHFGQGTLVMRQQGLSLARTTPFGLHVSRGENGWNHLHDSISGLQTDLSSARNVYLMTDASDRRPLLAMGEPGQAVDLSIRLDGHVWESPAITALLRRFDAVSLDCHESRQLGAGAWLDEWETPAPAVADGGLLQAAGEVLRSCEWLEVRVRTRTHGSVVCFTPSFIDSEGGVLRVADRACRHVVYADVEAPEFRLEHMADGRARIFRESPALGLAI